jgi:GGDEF domain-containing protein
MGGDEFCMISPERDNMLAAQRAIEDRGPGFCISASLGTANIPDDASDVTAAIAIADRRMYTSKQARPGSVDQQVTNVLLRALAKRHRPLGGHSDNVSKLARRTAHELNVGDDHPGDRDRQQSP